MNEQRAREFYGNTAYDNAKDKEKLHSAVKTFDLGMKIDQRVRDGDKTANPDNVTRSINLAAKYENEAFA